MQRTCIPLYQVDLQPVGISLNKKRAGDGIRTHGMVAWEATALPLGDTRAVVRILNYVG
jgi:hypothetical protein